MPVILGERATGRDNNLNLVRAVAATGVLVSHAWPISLGPGTTEPLEELTGFSLGALCVFVFFSISGYLITASWQRSQDVRTFLIARVLRLWPALLVSLVLVAFVMAPLVASRPAAEQIGDPATWTFLVRNLALVHPQFVLPGVFEDNPYRAVEGSIWTLVYEVACYVGVLFLGVLGLAAPRRLGWSLAVYFAVWIALLPLLDQLHPKLSTLHRMSLPFAVGMAFFALRDRLRLSAPIAASLVVGAVLVSGWEADVIGRGGPIGLVALSVALAYLAFWIAYVPAGPLRGYNRIGDYSYGIYIYAFPLQGLVVWAFGPMSPWENIAVALPLTLLPSILSWHLIERPALRLARRGGSRQVRPMAYSEPSPAHRR